MVAAVATAAARVGLASAAMATRAGTTGWSTIVSMETIVTTRTIARYRLVNVAIAPSPRRNSLTVSGRGYRDPGCRPSVLVTILVAASTGHGPLTDSTCRVRLDSADLRRHLVLD